MWEKARREAQEVMNVMGLLLNWSCCWPVRRWSRAGAGWELSPLSRTMVEAAGSQGMTIRKAGGGRGMCWASIECWSPMEDSAGGRRGMLTLLGSVRTKKGQSGQWQQRLSGVVRTLGTFDTMLQWRLEICEFSGKVDSSRLKHASGWMVGGWDILLGGR